MTFIGFSRRMRARLYLISIDFSVLRVGMGTGGTGAGTGAVGTLMSIEE